MLSPAISLVARKWVGFSADAVQIQTGEDTTMLRIEGDRRRHPRVEVTQPCKICDPRSGRYLAGTTRDLSSHGLLIELPRLIDLKPGDRLHVGVAMKRRQGLMLAKEMIEAKVVRTMPTIDDHTLLAVEFEQPVSIAAESVVESRRLAA